MDLQTYVTETLAAERQKRFDRSDQLSLGQLISELEKVDKISDDSEMTVWLDFECLFPTEFGSWRGSYVELALRFTSRDFDYEAKRFNVQEFLQLCRSTVGKTFTGYKGGDYTMTLATPVWIANYGNSGKTALIGVECDGYSVKLITGQREF